MFSVALHATGCSPIDCNFQRFQNTHSKHFSCILFLLKQEILDCHPRLQSNFKKFFTFLLQRKDALGTRLLDCRLTHQKKRDSFWKILLGILENLEYTFFSEHFKKSIRGEFFSSVVDCRLELRSSAMISKVNSTTYIFQDISRAAIS